MPPPKPVIGIDLGGTNMQIGVVANLNTDNPQVVGEARRKTKPEDGRDVVIERMIDGIKEACQGAGIAPEKISEKLGCIGVAAPGAVDPEEGVVLEAVNLRWTDVPLAKIVTDRLKVQTILDNDVNAAVYGEHEIGSGKRCGNLLGVWLGTGIGGGLIFNGQLYYGHYLTAGEIGHTILFPGNPPGSRSLEHNCSRSAVVDRIVRLVSSNRKSSITAMVDGDYSKVKSKIVGKAFEEKDELTMEVVENTAQMLGMAIGSWVSVLSLPRIVLGGGLTEALGQPFVDMVQKATRKIAFPDRCKRVEVVASKLLDNAGVFGAAMIAQARIERLKR